MQHGILPTLLLASPALALGGEDELDFTIRPGAELATALEFDALAAASDHEQTVVVYATGGATVLSALDSDGRGLAGGAAVGGFDAPTVLTSGGGVIVLDEEGVRVTGDRAVVAWIDRPAAGNATALFTQRANPAAAWSAPTGFSAFPAGDVEGLEIVLTREISPSFQAAANVAGELWLTTSSDLGETFTAGQLASALGSPVETFDYEAQADRVALAFTDSRGNGGGDGLWVRTGTLGAGTGVTLDPEVLIFDESGLQVLDTELALEGDRITVAFLVETPGSDSRVWFAHSFDAGLTWSAADQLPATTDVSGSPFTVLDFDLEITNDHTQIAVEEARGGVSFIGRADAVDPLSAFDWTVELVTEGTSPRFPRLEGNEVDGDPPGSCSLVYSTPDTAPGSTTLGAISADQDDGCEYHDELVTVGPDSGTPPTSVLDRFAVAYNRRYDNHVMPFVLDDVTDSLGVTGYRPLTMAVEEISPTSFDGILRFGHVPFQNTFLFALVSLSEGYGSVILPADGRETGLQFDALTALGLTEPYFTAFLLAVNEPAEEGGETAVIPGLQFPGVPIKAVGISVDANGNLAKLTDVLDVN